MAINSAALVPISGFDGYFVGMDGSIWSGKQSGRWLKPSVNKHGYLTVGLHRNGKRYRKYIHRLVAEAFIPNPLNMPQVNHKDEDKSNNYVENLEWCTAEYNSNHGTRNARIAKPVINLDSGISYASATEASKRLGISESQISEVCSHKPKRLTAGGFHWAFAKDGD